ncbi:hypothetical protein BGW80DRAFT_428892 [Lactifluus volemus]|nr:hypothetical protein BGW80DRAFT_428892 [Lactifluus volemus]
MRQHQSAFVPLGPHVEKDVPRRLVQLANENAIFFDPFEEYVIVPEVTRQKYAERRQELLAEGVDPANLSVFGAALTQHLSASKRVTNAAVASYKERFLLTQRKRPQDRSQSRRAGLVLLTREESLMSIADAICPATLIQQEPEETLTPEGDNTHRNAVLRRGQSIVMDIIGYRGGSVVEGTVTGQGRSQLRRGNSVLREISGIIHHRDALEVENSRLRSLAEQC